MLSKSSDNDEDSDELWSFNMSVLCVLLLIVTVILK